jgi:hypothetical protein
MVPLMPNKTTLRGSKVDWRIVKRAPDPENDESDTKGVPYQSEGLRLRSLPWITAAATPYRNAVPLFPYSS